MIFSFADILMDFEGSNEYFVNRSISFLKQNKSNDRLYECDMRVSIDLDYKIPVPKGEEVIIDNDAIILKKVFPQQGYYIYLKSPIKKKRSDATVALMDTDMYWSDVKLTYMNTDQVFTPKNSSNPVSWIQYHSFLAIGSAYRNVLLQRNGLQIHSSSIEIDGKGLIFSAASGTGKSTHTKLWKELYGDRISIINDDRPAIRYMDETPMLCGIPWSGTSNNFTNQIVPLNCIVMLERANSNSIKRLNAAEAIHLLMPRCFLPYYDKDMMDMAINTLERLIKDVPVYYLKCSPDYEAVELVRKCVM